MARDVPRSRGMETGQSWVIACVALLVLSIAYGAPLVTVVALQPIAAEFGTQRAAPALAVSLTYVGSGMGGVAMGWVAGRIGMRYIGMVCGLMIALGLFLVSSGGLYRLYACNLLLLGLLGGAGMFSPTIAYVTRWFDRRRGSAVALVSSGQYVAGAIWPVLLQVGIDRYGWRRAMMLYGILIAVTVPALAGLFCRHPAEPHADALVAASAPSRFHGAGGLNPNLVQAILGAAIFCCCTTMSIPLAHIVAFCGDIGVGARSGAIMLSLQLGAGVVAQQIWGWTADRVGGLRTIFYASAAMAASMAAFLLSQDEFGLYSVSAAFGLAFGD